MIYFSYTVSVVNSATYYIIGAYRPPDSTLVLFNDALSEMLVDEHVATNFSILAGDLNRY